MRDQYLIGLGVSAVVLGGGLVTLLLFLISLQNALARCRPRCRKMAPGLVWLNLIPCCQQVWAFVTCVQVSRSLAAEFKARGLKGGGGFGMGVGLTALLATGLGFLLSLFAARMEHVFHDEESYIAYMVVWAASVLAAALLGVMYWVKVAGYTRTLVADGRWQDKDRDDLGVDSRDDDYDDYDRPPRRPPPPKRNYDDDYR